MVQPGDEITYTFSNAKETEDISAIDEVIIRRMDGAGGGAHYTQSGGSGGQIVNARADVSVDSTLELWVGQAGYTPSGGFGRSFGGDGGGDRAGDTGGGGGSTEVVTDSGLVAAADAGGGAAFEEDGGGGGARGGQGGEGDDFSKDGEGGEGGGGAGFGGAGGDFFDRAGKDGGQELGLASLLDRGSTSTGGGSGGNYDGEIVLQFDKPLKPLSLSASEDTAGTDPAVDLSWDNDIERMNRIYRSTGASATFPDDFTEVASAGEGVTTYTDSPPDYEVTYTYRVTAESVTESDPSAPATITTSSEGELAVTITNTNSPVTTGDILDLDVEVENVGGYRAEETIDADLEPQ